MEDVGPSVHRCNMSVSVKFGNGMSHPAEAVTISETGMRVIPDRYPAAWVDDDVDIRCPELGCVSGKVIRIHGRRIDVEFHPTTDLAAKFAAFKKFYFNETVRKRDVAGPLLAGQ